VSAIRGMGAFIAKVENELYPRLAQRRTEMPVIPDGARQSTLNFNSLHGGLPEQKDTDGFPSALVADRCRIVLDRRYLMEEDEDEVRGEVVAILEGLKAERPEFDYALKELWSVPPTMTDTSSPLVRALDRNIEAVLGHPSRHVASPGTYDQKHVQRIGHLENCVAYGPGILELAHQPDEYIDIADMVASAQVMALTALDLLRGQP